jgi:uncharacterized protein (TIGR02117 family)
MLRKTFKWAIRIFCALLILVVVYFIAAFTLPYIPVNSGFAPCEKDGITIYLLTNGVHTDFVLSLKNEQKDWTKSIDPANTKSSSIHAHYISFGWGDKAFYLDTPSWSDLKFRTAFNALFYLGDAAIHVTFYYEISEDESCRKININRESYRKLVNYIEEGFDQDSAGNYILIKGASYGNNDLFYEAKGSYNLFYTCNTWTNSGLKAAHLKACLWTPFNKGIFYQYRK